MNMVKTIENKIRQISVTQIKKILYFFTFSRLLAIISVIFTLDVSLTTSFLCNSNYCHLALSLNNLTRHYHVT